MLDLRRRRSAKDGLSSASTASSAGTISSAWGKALALVDQRLQSRRIAEQQEGRAGIALARDVGAIDDDVGRVIAAHAVERQNDLARAHRDAPPVGCQRIAGGACDYFSADALSARTGMSSR